jgi:hypothetical protein
LGCSLKVVLGLEKWAVVGKEGCGLVAKQVQPTRLSLSYARKGMVGRFGLWKTIVHDNWGT